MKFNEAVEIYSEAKSFDQLLKKFIKKEDVAYRAMGVRSGLSEAWWHKHGQPLQNIIDELWDNYEEEFKEWMQAKPREWVPTKPTIGDLMA